MTAPDTMKVNRDHVTIAPHHWTRVSRMFDRPRPRNWWQRMTDWLLRRKPETEALIVTVHVRASNTLDLSLDLVGASIEPAGPHHRHMRDIDVQD